MNMPKNNYWQKRFEKRKSEGMAEAEAFNKNMAKRYAYIIDQVKKDVDYWYYRYARENHLTLAEAKKQLRAGELKAFKLTLEEFTKLAQEEELDPATIKMLNQASIRIRLTRQEEIYIMLSMRVEQALQALKQDFKPLLRDVYEDSYYKSLYEVQNVTGYSHITRLATEELDKIITNPWANDGKIFSERIWENQSRLINTLQYELTQSLILQEGGAPLVGRMQHRFDVSFKDARRLVETETAFVQEQAFIDSMKTLNVKQYQIIATLDNRTSPTCRKLDLKIFDLKDAKPGVTTPPFHCYCRSTTAPYIAGISDDVGETRTARLRGDGKSHNVSAKLTYDEWRKEYIDGR